MSRKLKALFGIVTVFVALVLLASSTYAYTQGNTLMATMRGQTAVASDTTAGLVFGPMNGMMGNGPRGGGPMGNGPQGGGPLDGVIDREVMKETLANALGISVDELEAARTEGKTLEDLAAEKGVDMADVQVAMEAARAEAIAQAVTDGTITQAQADEMLSHAWQPNGPMGHGGPGGGLLEGVIDPAAMHETLANVLGVTVEELQAAREQGKTLEELAAEKGVDMADVQAAMDAARTDAVNQAVADGIITQAQADQILSHPWHPGGGPHGHGGPQHGPQNDNIPAQPNTLPANNAADQNNG